MEYYNVFLRVILKEIARFKLDTEVYSTYAAQLTAALDVNFDVPYNRCAYMYRYATNIIYFFKDCIANFLLECPHSKDMLSEWKSLSEVKVCSLSIGPGLDYLAFMLALSEYDPVLPNINGAKVVSKNGAWRNTVSFILEVFREKGLAFEVPWPQLKYENLEIIQADLLRSFSDNQRIVAVYEANVVLMMKTLNLLATGTPEEGPLLHMLKEMISSLKSEATIFCIDTKPSLALLTQALSQFPGKFLHGPTHQTIVLPIDFPEAQVCRPVKSVRGVFFVWQKLPVSSSLTNLISMPLKNIYVGTENKGDNVAVTSNNCDKSICTVGSEINVENKETHLLSTPLEIYVGTENKGEHVTVTSNNCDKSTSSVGSETNVEDKETNFISTPLEIYVGTENKGDNVAVTSNNCDKSTCSVGRETNVEDKDSDNILNLPWIELKTFWRSSSPKTKELLKKLMLTDEESLEEISDLISHSGEVDMANKQSLNITHSSSLLENIDSNVASLVQKTLQNITNSAMLENIESSIVSEVQKALYNNTNSVMVEEDIESQVQKAMFNEVKTVSVTCKQMPLASNDNLKVTTSHNSNVQNMLHEGNSSDSVESISPSDTINSLSSFTCENDSPTNRIGEKSASMLPNCSETLNRCHAADSVQLNSKESAIAEGSIAKISPSKNKVIQTDACENIAKTSNSVKELTERIRQLAISLESVSQQNELPDCYDCDLNESPNCPTTASFIPDSNNHSSAIPSSSKHSPKCGFKGNDSLPSYKSSAQKRAYCHYNCHTCHNGCNMYCSSRFCNFQPCYTHPVPICNCSCSSRHQSRNSEDLTSPNIVIPIQHISDNALSKIISILKSESKSN